MPKQTPQILSSKPLAGSESKFVELKQITYRDETGKEVSPDVSEWVRGDGLAVAIFALLHSPSQPIRTIVIEQYRPPIGKTIIELPAGLVDEGEGPEKTAMRELAEETGYAGGSREGGEGKVKSVSGVLVADPGMTDANMHLVTVDVQLPAGELAAPKPKLEAGEHIVQKLVEVSQLWETLQEYESRGFVIDARLGHLAYGLHIAKQLSTSTTSAATAPSDEEIREAESTAKNQDAVERNGETGEIIGEEVRMPVS